MSKKNGNDQEKNCADNNHLTVEEHKKNLNIDAPVFAAVMQTNKWGSGKRVPEAAFKKAVEEFLGAPMDGVKNDAPAVKDKKSGDQTGGNEPPKEGE